MFRHHLSQIIINLDQSDLCNSQESMISNLLKHGRMALNVTNTMLLRDMFARASHDSIVVYIYAMGKCNTILSAYTW